MFRLEPNARKTDTVIVMLLYFLFAVTAFILILIGIKQYNHTTKSINDNYQIRTTSSYITEKIRQHDGGFGISVTSINTSSGAPVSAIAFSEMIENKLYTTYIYFYDGYLRELFINNDSVYTIESGQPIVELQNFIVNTENNNSFSVLFTSTNGTSQKMFIRG